MRPAPSRFTHLLALVAGPGLALAVAGGVAAKGDAAAVIAPFEPVAGQPVTVAMSLTMGGHPLPADIGGAVILSFTDAATGDVVEARATPSAAGGDSWEATVVLPHAAIWTADLWLDFGSDQVRFETVTGATRVEVPSAPLVTEPGMWAAALGGAVALLIVLLSLVRGRMPALRMRRRTA